MRISRNSWPCFFLSGLRKCFVCLRLGPRVCVCVLFCCWDNINNFTVVHFELPPWYIVWWSLSWNLEEGIGPWIDSGAMVLVWDHFKMDEYEKEIYIFVWRMSNLTIFWGILDWLGWWGRLSTRTCDYSWILLDSDNVTEFLLSATFCTCRIVYILFEEYWSSCDKGISLSILATWTSSG